MTADFRLSYVQDADPNNLSAVLSQVVGMLRGDTQFAAPMSMKGFNTPGETAVEYQQNAPNTGVFKLYDAQGNVLLNADSGPGSGPGSLIGPAGLPMTTSENTQTLKNKTLPAGGGNHIDASQVDSGVFGAARIGAGMKQLAFVKGTADYASGATTNTDLTNLSLTLTPLAGSSLVVLLMCPFWGASGGVDVRFITSLDGTNQPTDMGFMASDSGELRQFCGFHVYTGLTAASHTVKGRARRTSGTVNVNYGLERGLMLIEFAP